MWKKTKKGHFADTTLELAPHEVVPLRLHYERRNGYRASIGKKQLIFRLPLGLNQDQAQDLINRLTEWAKQTHAKDPMHFAHLLPKKVPHRGQVVIMGRRFRVQVETGSFIQSHKATFDEYDSELILIELSGEPPEDKIGDITETLISRLSSQRFLPQITQRVMELNRQFFQQPISGVTLKLTKSQWGSCSSKGNINLSSRLLLVPQAPRDAVIIHELAHRIEMNHSDRFWKLVYDAMPDYDQQHAYLNKYGRELSFLPV